MAGLWGVSRAIEPLDSNGLSWLKLDLTHGTIMRGISGMQPGRLPFPRCSDITNHSVV